MDNIFLLAVNPDSHITTRIMSKETNIKIDNASFFLCYQIFPVNVKQQVCEFQRLTVEDADRDTQFQHTHTHIFKT